MRSVATIGRWSMRRPWRAIGAWLLFVVLAVAFGVATGTQSLENGAVGESARGYALMDRHEAWPPAREYVLGERNWYLPPLPRANPRAEIEAPPARDAS